MILTLSKRTFRKRNIRCGYTFSLTTQWHLDFYVNFRSSASNTLCSQLHYCNDQNLMKCSKSVLKYCFYTNFQRPIIDCIFLFEEMIKGVTPPVTPGLFGLFHISRSVLP